MKYDFHCEECDTLIEKDISIADFRNLPDKSMPCEVSGCGGTSKYHFNASSLEVCFKGMRWSDKNHKEKVYRNNRSAYLGAKQKECHHNPQLIANYKGQRTQDWKEAKEMARQEGKASTSYDPLIQKEAQKP